MMDTRILSDKNFVNKQFINTLRDMYFHSLRTYQHRIAIVYKESAYTFQTVEVESNKFKSALAMVLGENTGPVVINLYNCPELIFIVVALIKLGLPMVLVDPSFPRDRVATICEACSASLLITWNKTEYDTITAMTVKELLSYKTTKSLRKIYPLCRDDIAYIVYTSGSTGIPKGIAIPHRAICNYLDFAYKHYKVTAKSHFALCTSISFDLTLTSLLLPICYGCVLHIIDNEFSQLNSVQEAFSNVKLTHLKLTPSHLKLLINLNLPEYSNIKYIIVGGEAFSSLLAHNIYLKFNQRVDIINEYGPSETTIGVSSHLYSFADDRLSDVPIGKPIQATEFYLDAKQADTNKELLVAGQCLALGYWQNPRLTAEKFIPCAIGFAKRVYKTGDLVESDQCLLWHYHGRVDNQIKLNGFRIELSEIEATVIKWGKADSCVVSVYDLDEKRHFPQNPKRIKLCVYIKINNFSQLLEEELKNFLAEKLPHYMLPEYIIPLIAIPLTTNGKVDYAILPEPNAYQKATEVNLNAREKLIAKIWAEALNIDQETIYANSDFFSIGGDSITAIYVMQKCAEHAINIDVRCLLENPILADFVLQLEKDNRITSSKSEQAAQTEFNLSPVQKKYLDTANNINDFSQGVLITLEHLTLTTEILKDIIYSVLDSYDVFKYELSVNQSNIPKLSKLPVLIEDLNLNADITTEYMEAEISKAFAKINVEKQIYIYCLIISHHKKKYLILVVHHLLIDAVSFQLILDHLDSLIKADKAHVARKQSYYQWLTDINKAEVLLLGKPYWERRVKKHSSKQRDKIVTYYSDISTFTKTLNKAGLVIGKNMEAMLLTVFINAYGKFFTVGNEIFLNFEKSGRRLVSKFIDPSMLIGWLSSYNPMLITDLSTKSIMQLYFEVLFEITNLPELPFGCYSYLDADKSLAGYQFPNIMFNYLGKIDRDNSRCFSVKPVMSNHGNGATQVFSAFEIIIYQAKDNLYLHINYNNKVYHTEKMKQFAEMFQDVLIRANNIIKYKPGVYVYDYQISDFDYYDTNLLKQLNYSFADIERVALVNPQQADLFLFAEYFSQAKNAYYQELNLRFSGNYNLNTLAKALQRLVSEFEVFRTIFVELEAYQIYQITLLKKSLVLITVNNECILGDHFGFEVDIKKGPLAIFKLTSISDQQFELTLQYHHITMDGWSLINLFKRFFWILSAISYGQLIEDYSYPMQSDVYTQHLNTDLRNQSLNYWQDLLTQFQLGTFKLPAIVHAEPNRAAAYETFKFTLSTRQAEQFRSIINRHHVSPSILMHAVLAIILFRYYGLSTLCFGTVISGRESGISNIENMVGLFSRTIPEVVSISKHLVIEDLFATIRQQIDTGAKHSVLSLGEIQRLVLKKGRLFDVLLVVENYPFASNVTRLLENYKLPFKLDNIKFLENTHYPLTITFYPGESLSIDVQFNTDIFPAEFIIEFKTHVLSILSQIYEASSLNVYFATLYNKVYKQQYLHDYVYGLQRELPNTSVIDYFYQQLTVHLHRVAVVQANKFYSYAYIDKHSDKLASYLYNKGFAAGSCIGILLGRHVDRLIAWLAVLKLGAHYLPLDLNLAKDRIEFMLQDAAADVVVTHSKYKELLSTNDILNYDEIKISEAYKKLRRSFKSAVYSKSIFNIIYTSGSSGKPKGVMVTYEAILNYFLWMKEYLNITEKDKMMQILSFSFDPAVTEMFILLMGGSLLFLPDAKQLDLVSLEHVANKYQATIAQMVPSIFNSILLGAITLPDSLQHIICGAEKLEKKYVVKLYQAYKNITVHNLYGLTETTIDSTSYRCPKQIANENIPIGKPFVNQRAMILDKALQLVPIGLLGNIYLGGCGVSLGYIAQPRKTAEKFIPDPLAFGERMYDTGDLGFLHQDGNIEFIGRLDRQVKLRGIRIELDEVESIVRSYPEIADAAVIIKAVGNQKQLCVFYVANKIIADHILREWLASKYSSAVNPSYIIKLKDIPKTPNNKNDYKKLANLNITTGLRDRKEFVTSQTEEQLVSILAAILEVNVSAVDIGVGFFDLGLDSILLMRFHAEICKQVNKQVTMNHLFIHTTVSSLARFINEQSGNDTGKNIVSAARIRKQLAAQARRNR